MARASLWLGLASYVLLLGPFTGIPAIFAGHMALRRLRRDPAVYGGSGAAITGLVLGYVSLLVGLPLMALAACWVVPKFLDAQARTQAEQCSGNLTALAAAARQHANTHGQRFPTRLSDVQPTLATPSIALCPSDTLRSAPKGPADSKDDSETFSYDLLQPGGNPAESGDRSLLRCPIHGTTVTATGTLKPGKIGPSKQRRKREL